MYFFPNSVLVLSRFIILLRCLTGMIIYIVVVNMGVDRAQKWLRDHSSLLLALKWRSRTASKKFVTRFTKRPDEHSSRVKSNPFSWKRFTEICLTTRVNVFHWLCKFTNSWIYKLVLRKIGNSSLQTWLPQTALILIIHCVRDISSCSTEA